MNKLIRLTESDLHRIVKESVNRILNETSHDMLVRAMDASNDKVANAEEAYGKNSYPASAARNQQDYFSKEYDRRFQKANPRERARMEKLRIDAKNKRLGTTAGQRERQMQASQTPKESSKKKSGFLGMFKKK